MRNVRNEGGKKTGSLLSRSLSSDGIANNCSQYSLANASLILERKKLQAGTKEGKENTLENTFLKSRMLKVN